MSITRMTDLDLAGKRVLIRQDLNVPVADGKVTSDQRITAAGSLEINAQVGDVRVRAAEPGESPHVTTTRTWGLWEPSTSTLSSPRTLRASSRPSAATPAPPLSPGTSSARPGARGWDRACSCSSP